MTVVVLKLITSAEVVGNLEWTSDFDNKRDITLENPKGVVAARDQQGSISWNLAPFMISSPDSVATIRYDHIVAWAKADAALTEVFTKLTTKIELAGAD